MVLLSDTYTNGGPLKTQGFSHSESSQVPSYQDQISNLESLNATLQIKQACYLILEQIPDSKLAKAHEALSAILAEPAVSADKVTR